MSEWRRFFAWLWSRPVAPCTTCVQHAEARRILDAAVAELEARIQHIEAAAAVRRATEQEERHD